MHGLGHWVHVQSGHHLVPLLVVQHGLLAGMAELPVIIIASIHLLVLVMLVTLHLLVDIHDIIIALVGLLYKERVLCLTMVLGLLHNKQLVVVSLKHSLNILLNLILLLQLGLTLELKSLLVRVVDRVNLNKICNFLTSR